jgi:hypothetical protein
MRKFLEFTGYRTEIYKKQFPTGSRLGVKKLAIPEFMIEIELEVQKQINKLKTRIMKKNKSLTHFTKYSQQEICLHF